MKSWIYFGGESAVMSKDVVGIFDLDNASWAIDTRKFLSAADKNKKVINAFDDIPKSMVVCTDGNVILAQPNSAILAKRWESNQ